MQPSALDLYCCADRKRLYGNVMSIPAILGIGLIIIVLLDAFETVVFPRRVTRRIRLVRLFYRTTWWLYTGMVQTLSSKKRQETYLSYYGPLSLPILLAFWAGVLIIGFSLLYWSSGDSIKEAGGIADFASCLYFSGTTFFTLGLGDIVPKNDCFENARRSRSRHGFWLPRHHYQLSPCAQSVFFQEGGFHFHFWMHAQDLRRRQRKYCSGIVKIMSWRQ